MSRSKGATRCSSCLKARRRAVQKVYIADAQDSSDILDAIEFEAQRQRVPVQVVSMTRLDREARTEGHQGVMAIASRLETVGLDDLLKKPRPFLLVCDGVTDPRNLGAMLRSADGAGVTGVVVPRHRSARISPSVTKTAAGAVEYLTFCDVGGIPAALDQLNRAGVLTVGLAGESKDSIYDLDLGSTPVALVVGGEEKGLSRIDAQEMRGRCVDTPVGQDQLVERGCRGVRRRFRSGASAQRAFLESEDNLGHCALGDRFGSSVACGRSCKSVAIFIHRGSRSR